jgi:hypothetical protein
MWNALALMAFSEAARYLDKIYLQPAIRTGRFLINHLYRDGILFRSWRNGKAQLPAYLEDYASLILAFLSLYQSDPDQAWFEWAYRLAEEMMGHFRNPEGGFFDTQDSQESLILRPQEFQDNTTPSGNALAATALLQLSIFTGRVDWRENADQMLDKISASSTRYPTAFSGWLCTEDFRAGPVREVAIVGDPASPSTQALIAALWSEYRADMLAAISPNPVPPAAPVLLQDRGLVNSLPTAYVCENMACRLPVNDPDDLRRQLAPGGEL